MTSAILMLASGKLRQDLLSVLSVQLAIHFQPGQPQPKVINISLCALVLCITD